MRTNAIIRIIIYSLVILILSGILISVLFFGLYVADGRVQSHHSDEHIASIEGVVTQEIFSNDIKNIEIEWVAGSITIQPSTTANDIQITESFGRDVSQTMVCRQSGQTLKIQFSEESMKFPSFGINVDYSKDLVITVPENWIGNSLEIDAASTEVEVHDLNINELDFDGASGRLTLDNCEIVELDIDTASGDVEFTGILKELDFDAASAKFEGEFFQIPNHLNLDTMSGDLTIVLPEYCGFELTLDTMSGSFDSDFEFNTMGATYKVGDGACKIKVSAMSGDVSILKGISEPKNCDH